MTSTKVMENSKGEELAYSMDESSECLYTMEVNLDPGGNKTMHEKSIQIVSLAIKLEGMSTAGSMQSLNMDIVTLFGTEF